MSYRAERKLSLINNINEGSLNEQFRKSLETGMHGIAFSPYEEGQEPGDQLSEAQIRRRLEILRPYTKWVRSFSCTEGNELIPRIAKEYGMSTLVGAWLSDDAEKNEKEIEGLIQLAKDGFVDLAAVGNEVLYREELSLSQLLSIISKVRDRIPHVPVSYVDAYYEFENRPELTEACDVIMANCYPFWEGCHADYAILYMKDMYRRTVNAAKGKQVIISECGWPNKGQELYGAVPSTHSAMKYFIETQRWSREEDIEIFYFSSFDESWKVSAEGDVGAYWGLWDKNEKLKY